MTYFKWNKHRIRHMLTALLFFLPNAMLKSGPIGFIGFIIGLNMALFGAACWEHMACIRKLMNPTKKELLLKVCNCVFSRVHATLQPALSVGPAVGRIVNNSLLFWRLRAVFGLQLLPNCLAALFHYCPCPPARD